MTIDPAVGRNINLTIVALIIETPCLNVKRAGGRQTDGAEILNRDVPCSSSQTNTGQDASLPTINSGVCVENTVTRASGGNSLTGHIEVVVLVDLV